jgi:4-hydroxybenzoate polyprenyltransferase
MCVVEARPLVQTIFLIRFVCGAGLSGHDGRVVTAGRLLLGIATWECAILFTYLLNGITDVAEDRINQSSRPIASGRLSIETGIRGVVGAGIISLVGGGLLGLRELLLVAIMVVLGYAYSSPPFRLKARPFAAAATVTAAGGLTYLAGGAAVRGSISAQLILFATVMALWMGVVGAATKDFPDIAGDAAAGRRGSPAVRWELARRVLLPIAAVALGAGLGVGAAFLAPALLAPAAVLLAGGAWVARRCATLRLDGTNLERRRPYQAFMATQYAVHAVYIVLAVSPLLLPNRSK